MRHDPWEGYYIGSPTARVFEECTELMTALCKAECFGWFNPHPDRPDRRNIEDVKAKMDDVVEAIERLQEHMRQIQYDHFKSQEAR
jgi:hypothetical protein